MELEIYSAFVNAGIPPEAAKAAVDSISKEIDKRYALHSQQLATHGDIETVRKEVADVKTSMAEMESRLMRAMADMQRWTITALFAAVGLFAAVSKIWH
jgi:predicted MarR family transcription regulator